MRGARANYLRPRPFIQSPPTPFPRSVISEERAHQYSVPRHDRDYVNYCSLCAHVRYPRPFHHDHHTARVMEEFSFYFSFGSNMSTCRISKNCPAGSATAEFVDAARLDNHELQFSGPDWPTWHRAVANVTQTPNENKVVWGCPVEDIT